MEKVSIIIPIYNVSLYVEESLKSAFGQTYTNIEYIIIDDRGKDDSMLVVQRLIKQNPTKNIKVIQHNVNKGLSAARNTGIQHSTGKYIFFMDSDDTISSECIESMYDVAKKYNADFVDGNTNVVGGKDTLFPHYRGLDCISKDIPYSFFKGELHPSACNKLLSREFIINNNIAFVEGLIYEDILFVLDICRYANTICTIDKFTYNYITHPGSITTTMTELRIKRQYESIFYILEQIYNYAESLSIKSVKNELYKWTLKFSFKSACRLSVSNIEYSITCSYYNKLSEINKRNYGNKLLLFMQRIPFWLFKCLFYLPYKCYKLYT